MIKTQNYKTIKTIQDYYKLVNQDFNDLDDNERFSVVIWKFS